MLLFQDLNPHTHMGATMLFFLIILYYIPFQSIHTLVDATIINVYS